ncbi:MAG: protein jag [Dehalococcoidales bacterium]|nr:protein jag [Dehalococcoidales bacterium]
MEVSARSVEEAIRQALEQLSVSREEVKVSIIKEGRRGILGVGGEPAVVRVEPLASLSQPDSQVIEVAKGVLETLLGKIGVAATVVIQDKSKVESGVSQIVFDIKGEDLGILIGRRGHTLACLQFILRLIVGHQIGVWLPIVVDVEGYKARCSERLRALAQRLAERVRVGGVPFSLEPMLPYERRIIHIALADYPGVTTESIGEGNARKVVIYPK